jgi:predicted DNA-binding WGR domain protein
MSTEVFENPITGQKGSYYLSSSMSMKTETKTWSGKLYMLEAGQQGLAPACVVLQWGRNNTVSNNKILFFKTSVNAQNYFNSRLQDKRRKKYVACEGNFNVPPPPVTAAPSLVEWDVL